jgi:S-layer homology domain
VVSAGLDKIAVLYSSRSRLCLSLSLALLLPLTSCAGSPSGQALQEALKADSRLKDNPLPFGAASPVSSPQPTPSPTDFPPELPLYPQGKLGAVAGAMDGNVLTKWSASDDRDRVLSFYRQALQSNGWQDLKQSTDNGQEVLSGRHQNGLQVVVTLEPADEATQGTNFVIQYGRGAIAANPAATTQPDDQKDAPSGVPQPGDDDFIGPVPQKLAKSPVTEPIATSPQGFTDLDKISKQLQPYVADLAQLGVLTITPSKTKAAAGKSLFEPNRAITRREYARWLLAANNRIYAARSAKQIRLGNETASPAFQDVAKTDPDFATIQGLAEAGLLSSALAGDSTTVLFRPDAPLTREDMIAWKVPVDLRQALPIATIDAIKQTWGFQDATRIDARALKAVLADFQNGDQANIRRAFGYTTLFQPKRSVTRAEAAAALWYFGYQGDGLSAADALKEKSSSKSPVTTPATAPATAPTAAPSATPLATP